MKVEEGRCSQPYWGTPKGTQASLLLVSGFLLDIRGGEIAGSLVGGGARARGGVRAVKGNARQKET